MFKSRSGSESELCTNPIIFGARSDSSLKSRILDTIPVNRVFLISTRRSPPEKSLYFVFQRGGGFRWQTDGSGDGQQHCHAVRHGFAKGGLQTFNEPGRNLIEPQTRLGGVTLASAAPFEGCDVNSNPFPGDHDIGAGGSLPFPTLPRTVWRRLRWRFAPASSNPSCVPTSKIDPIVGKISPFLRWCGGQSKRRPEGHNPLQA